MIVPDGEVEWAKWRFPAAKSNGVPKLSLEVNMSSYASSSKIP